jgi:hypothetical protein
MGPSLPSELAVACWHQAVRCTRPRWSLRVPLPGDTAHSCPHVRYAGPSGGPVKNAMKASGAELSAERRLNHVCVIRTLQLGTGAARSYPCRGRNLSLWPPRQTPPNKAVILKNQAQSIRPACDLDWSCTTIPVGALGGGTEHSFQGSEHLILLTTEGHGACAAARLKEPSEPLRFYGKAWTAFNRGCCRSSAGRSGHDRRRGRGSGRRGGLSSRSLVGDGIHRTGRHHRSDTNCGHLGPATH